MATKNTSPRDRGTWRPSVIFGIIGSLVLIIASLVFMLWAPKDASFAEFSSQVLAEVGLTLVAVALLGVLWNLLGGEPTVNALQSLVAALDERVKGLLTRVGLLRDSQDTGVLRLWGTSNATDLKWLERLRASQERVDLMGMFLHHWAREYAFETEALDLVRRGVKIRVLMMDQENPNLGAFLNERGVSGVDKASVEGEFQTSVRAFSKTAESCVSLQTDTGGSFAFRQAGLGTIPCYVFRTDDEMVVIPYLYSVGAAQSPTMLIRGHKSALFSTYEREFDCLWNLNEP
jgi:hypothetical protein